MVLILRDVEGEALPRAAVSGLDRLELPALFKLLIPQHQYAADGLCVVLQGYAGVQFVCLGVSIREPLLDYEILDLAGLHGPFLTAFAPLVAVVKLLPDNVLLSSVCAWTRFAPRTSDEQE